MANLITRQSIQSADPQSLNPPHCSPPHYQQIMEKICNECRALVKDLSFGYYWAIQHNLKPYIQTGG